ncbi:hypothetical protein ACS0PU_009805 [Formica fusca]
MSRESNAPSERSRDGSGRKSPGLERERERKRKRIEAHRGAHTAQSGFIMRWSPESRICIAVAVAAVYEEDADISPRPRMPRRAFNIGNGPRIAASAADCENAGTRRVSGRREYEAPRTINVYSAIRVWMSNCR